MAIPEGAMGSLGVEPGLVTTDTVNPGDSSEIIVHLLNTGSPVTIHPGDLVARLMIHPDPRVKFIKVNELPAAPVEAPTSTEGLGDGELRERVERVRRAFLDEGAYPPYHRRQVERLRQEWPTLYRAILGLG